MMIQFKQKSYNFLDDVRLGAELGAAAGTMTGAAYHRFNSSGGDDKKSKAPLPKFLGKRFDKVRSDKLDKPNFIYEKNNNGFDRTRRRNDGHDERIHVKEWVDRTGKVVPESIVTTLSPEEIKNRGYEQLDAVERDSSGNPVMTRERVERVALSGYQYGLIGTAAGIIIGASLGALAGVIKIIHNKFNRKTTVDARLLKDVTRKLINQRFIEGKHFTKDPKRATDLKTKICIAITKSSGELKLLVNVQSDPKLNSVSEEMIKCIKDNFHSTVNQEATDKFNDIRITNISNTKLDADIITAIASYFIKAGYPVYLVEVG